MVSLPIVETLVNFVLWGLTVGGLLGLVLLMAVESFGLPPLPSEVILPFAGYLIYTGAFPAVPAVLAALLGGVLGSFIAYAFGRYGRELLTRGPPLLRVRPEHLAAMDGWFQRHGEGTVFYSRLLPVIRSYVSYPAGTARMPTVRFGLYTLAGATPFTIALMYAGYALGAHWSVIIGYFHLLDYAVVAAIGVGLVYLVLVWRQVVAPGWPPRLTRSTGPLPPAGAAPPSATGPRSPPG